MEYLAAISVLTLLLFMSRSVRAYRNGYRDGLAAAKSNERERDELLGVIERVGIPCTIVASSHSRDGGYEVIQRYS
jgi:hypothetical protein